MDAIGLSANRSIIRLSVLHLPIHDLGGERPIPATMALLEPFISRKGHPENMGDAREHTFEELCRIVGAIAASYGMRRVYLFGSRARAATTPRTATTTSSSFPMTTAGCSGSPGSSASCRRPSEM